LAVVVVGAVALAGSVELVGVDLGVLDVLVGETPPLGVDLVSVFVVEVGSVLVAGAGVVSVFGGGVVWL
jgi:hypothetical protein